MRLDSISSQDSKFTIVTKDSKFNVKSSDGSGMETDQAEQLDALYVNQRKL